MALHLPEPLCRSKKCSVEMITDRGFEFLFGSVIAANIEHFVDKEMKHRRRSLTPLEVAQDDHVFSKG